MQKLRQQLDAATERRLLALIRRANDSVSDIDMYRSRAHGYLLKEPIKRGRVLEMIRPWWIERFAGEDDPEKSQSQLPQDDACAPSADDLRESLAMIEALVDGADEAVRGKRWQAIREKLHALLGDLKTMRSKDSLIPIVVRIEHLIEGDRPPSNFPELWGDVKARVESTL